MKKILAFLTALILALGAACACAGADPGAETPAENGYTLEQVVILSRHNLRAPLSSNGSVPEELTPHEWIRWSSKSSELTLKGGIEETGMGQYFRKWLDAEGLLSEADFFSLFDRAAEAYDALEETYAQPEAA